MGGYGYPLEPPLGISCLYTYIKEKCPDVFVSCYDFRVSFKQRVISPNWFPHLTHKARFASELPELPEILLLIKNFREKPILTKAPYLDPCNNVLLDDATNKMIHMEVLKDYYDSLAHFARKEVNRLANDEIVGFSVFQTNVYATVLFSLLLRRHNPDVVIVAGGPQITQSQPTVELLLRLGVIDVAVLGEGEETIVDLEKTLTFLRVCEN